MFREEQPKVRESRLNMFRVCTWFHTSYSGAPWLRMCFLERSLCLCVDDSVVGEEDGFSVEYCSVNATIRCPTLPPDCHANTGPGSRTSIVDQHSELIKASKASKFVHEESEH